MIIPHWILKRSYVCILVLGGNTWIGPQGASKFVEVRSYGQIEPWLKPPRACLASRAWVKSILTLIFWTKFI